MSDIEQVQSFNPILILVWLLQIIIVAMDYDQDQRITWSIPIIGSFLIIQIYMIWKTNYDEMVKEQNNLLSKQLGGDLVKNTPLITPGVTNLQSANKKNATSSFVDLTLAPSLKEDEE